MVMVTNKDEKNKNNRRAVLGVPAALSSSSVSLGKTKVLMSQGVRIPPLLLGEMQPGSRKRGRAFKTLQDSQLST